MSEDMKSLDMTSYEDGLLDEKNHGFHEGACIRKYKNHYYLIYTDTGRGRATCLSYAMSDKPLGPYVKKGTIIDNIHCDPGTWNNHGCIADFQGKWYVFYHRSSQNSQFNRRMCAEPIHFMADGTIPEVEMTSQGCGVVLKAPGRLDASRACPVRNGAYIAPERQGEVLSHVSNGCWAAYRYVDFHNPRSCEILAASATGGGVVEIWADRHKLGECRVDNTGDWYTYRSFFCRLEPVQGVKTLFLVCRGEVSGSRLMELKEITFI